MEHFLLIILLSDDRILWTSLGTKFTCSIFLVLLLLSFTTLVLESRPESLHLGYCSSPRSASGDSCFYIKIFTKRNFRRHYNVDSSTILIESLKNQKQLQNFSNLLWKMWIRYRNSGDIEAYASVKTHRRVRSLWLQNCKDLHYKLELLACHLEVFREKGVLKNFAKFTWKHLCQGLVFTWIIFCYF